MTPQPVSCNLTTAIAAATTRGRPHII